MFYPRLAWPPRWFGILLALSLGLCGARVAHSNTDLVFIVDGSGSINSSDWSIQRNGIVAALNEPLVVPR